MLNLVIGQAIGIVGTIATFISYQVNTKRQVLFIQTLATLLTCVSYFFLGATSGFALNIVCVVRNVLFYYQKGSSKANTITAVILAVIMVVLGAFSWQGIVSLLIIIALAVNTIFLSLPKPQTLRKSIIFTSSLILIYNVFVFSIGGIINESIAIISSIIGIIRFKKR